MSPGRREAALLALVLALCVSGAHAADVAILKSSDAAAWRPTIDSLRQAAAAHTLTEYDFQGSRATGEGMLASLRGRNVVLVAMGPLAAQAARQVLPDVPMVFCMIQDPARIGINTAPGVAGVAFSIPVKNQLAAFRMVNPRGVRIGVLYNPEHSAGFVAEAEKAASILRVAVIGKPVASEREVPPALRAFLSGNDAVDALWIPPDPMILGDETRRFVLSEALKAGRPVYSFSASLLAEGALVSNGPDFGSIGQLVADLVNRLAAGDRSRIDMLVPRAELIINKKIANRLKVEIPADAQAAAKTF